LPAYGNRAARRYVRTMHTILHLLTLAATILVLSRLLPNVRIRSSGTSVVVAIVFSVLNLLLGKLIGAVLFVPAILTFGLLFLFVPFIVNTVLLWATDKLLASFEIGSPRALFVSAAAITVVNGLFHAHAMGAMFCPSHARWI
jgi:putative membrane protein